MRALAGGHQIVAAALHHDLVEIGTLDLRGDLEVIAGFAPDPPVGVVLAALVADAGGDQTEEIGNQAHEGWARESVARRTLPRKRQGRSPRGRADPSKYLRRLKITSSEESMRQSVMISLLCHRFS